MVHVGKGFDILKVEANVSLDLLVFKRFREDFIKIVLGTATNKLFDINSIKPEHKKIFTTQKDIVISTLNEAQKKGAYIRNDYKELINLAYLYLGENDKYKIHKPGTMHWARWLMKLLHSIKIVILKNNLLACTLRKGQLKLLKRFFFVFCYVPLWFTCPIGTTFAQNDIAFYKIVCT